MMRFFFDLFFISLFLTWAESAVTPSVSRPLFDQILEPVLGQVGTIKFVEEQINAIGGSLNRGIDLIHDTDHGTRICNEDDPLNNGVCFAPNKCDALGGNNIGTCQIITPKNACCKFDRTCGESSSETVTYFQNNANDPGTDPCVFTIRAHLGACQIRVDFLDFNFPLPDQETGVCDQDNSLEVLNQESPILPPISFFCGVNTGNHFYLPLTREHEPIQFRVRNKDKLVKDWNIKVTQVDCRSGLENMREIRAPDGCFQYFYHHLGPMATFNFDYNSPVHQNQEYSICFRSDSSVCALVLKSFLFKLPAENECSKGELVSSKRPCCTNPDSSLVIPGATKLLDTPTPFESERFCGNSFGDDENMLATFQKPFVARVRIGNGLETKGNPGFIMAYQLVTKCT